MRYKGKKYKKEESLHNREISNVVAITPVHNESIASIQYLNRRLKEVKDALIDRGIGFRYFFLDDHAKQLPHEGDFPILVSHAKNRGLARTLVDGYEAALKLHPTPDIIIRLDAQEHGPFKIPEIIDYFRNTTGEALLLPIWYKVQNIPAPLTKEIYEELQSFSLALSTFDKKNILKSYLRYPLGYQAYSSAALEVLVPKLRKGLDLFRKQEGIPPTWGLDLLAIMLASHVFKKKTDYLWGGWSTPWKSNRGIQKTKEQRHRASVMIKLAKELVKNPRK
ncbi:MAG: hypothetical protein Q8P45_01400 [Candidatus Harrisonbacteria bacterium]|nr:hypothetical protein [Candidatus Harrisonbacteria bacterium]